jgi:hypothetical protein
MKVVGILPPHQGFSSAGQAAANFIAQRNNCKQEYYQWEITLIIGCRTLRF